MVERQVSNRVGRIDYSEYADLLSAIKHVYLVGDLQEPTPHPFMRDDRVEFVLCCYKAGDDGEYHWHPHVTEYEIVVEGEIGYFEVATGQLHWFHGGDVCIIPAGVCVKRLVLQPARTVAVKVPSRNDKVYCAACPRECSCRVTPYQEG